MFERLIFERMETRVMVGITMFVAIILLVGWLAINEPGRMAAFDHQFLARSLERGAAMFSSRCATCHGADGRGQLGRAPALNNPQLFGYDFFAEINKQQTSLEAEQLQLAEELGNPATSQERRGEIVTRLAEISPELQQLKEQQQTLAEQILPAIDAGYVPEQPSRVLQLSWSATLRDFVYSTVTSGRPVSAAYWPQAMPPWGQSSGGPLRADQVEDLTNYVLNWDKGQDWTIEDLLAVNQFAKVPGAEAAAGPACETCVGTDVAGIMSQLPTVTGDPARGDALYHGREKTENGRTLPCSSCHEGGAAAPATVGTWTRIQSERLAASELAGYTGEQYIVESIVDPGKYLVSGYANVMPPNFGNMLTIQDLADLVAYLQTLE